MNWFKRLLNKFTEEEQSEELEKTDYIERTDFVEKADVGRPKFRFPLIPDDGEPVEEDTIPAPLPPRENRTGTTREPFAPSGGRLPLPKHLRAGRPENRGTREEPRFTEAPIQREPVRPETQETPVRPSSRKVAPVLDERPKPPKRTRGFMPSDVPSPVYGYKKPVAPPARPTSVAPPETGLADLIRERESDGGGRSADQLIDEHRPDSSLPLPKPGKKTERPFGRGETTQPTKAPLVSEDKNAAEHELSEEVVITRVSDLPKSRAQQSAVQNPETENSGPAAAPAKSMPEQKEMKEQCPPSLQEEKRTEETGQLDQKTEPAVSVQENHQPKRKTGTPFNVVMLKSDRQRLEQLERLKGLKPTTIRSAGQQPADCAEESRPAGPDRSREPEKAETPVPDSGTHGAGMTGETPQEPENVPAVHESVPDEQLPHYVFPDKEFLVEPEAKSQDYEWMESQAAKLEEALSYFAVKSKVIGMVQGPAVTQFELKVGQGTKVSKIRNLQDDLKLALAAKDIRIQAPIPGKSSIGIEIPNRVARPVRISEVIGSQAFEESDSPLEAVLGLDLAGRPSTIDLRKMPHGLIAGATGSGKSVCINSILTSLLYKATPDELRLLLIDPKMVELAPYNRIPHLVSPVITDVKAANAALKWAVEEMERRYELFAHAGVRDIARYNQKAEEHREFSKKLPYLLIVIDELADLMMVAPAEVEESICRIAQKARACGIHLVIATQRPSVDVITGLIKANVPTRIAFSVSSQVDSRTIIDVPGAERLLGRGDMLYLGNGMSAPARLQGTFVTDDEIERVTEYVRRSGEPNYLFRQEELIKKAESHESEDPLFEDACRFIAEAGSASTSMLQRKFSIGYNRAARLIDMLEDRGFVSPQKGSKPRDVYLTQETAAAIEQPGGPAHTI